MNNHSEAKFYAVVSAIAQFIEKADTASANAHAEKLRNAPPPMPGGRRLTVVSSLAKRQPTRYINS